MAEPRKKQVSLRGASAQEITRDALLEKVSQERELRNYSRRAAAAALFIQRVWRRYSVTKKISVQLQEEWEALVNHHDALMTSRWISCSLLRPFLFFITYSTTVHQKLRYKDVKCMLTCFKILLESINSTVSQKNFCSLAMGTLDERKTWLYQAKKLISVCLFILAECDYSCAGERETIFLTTLAMRLVVALTDPKGWKSFSSENIRDFDSAGKELVICTASGKSHLYSRIRRYIIKLDPRFAQNRKSGLQMEDHLLITASAVTLALRPFQVIKSNLNDFGLLDGQDVVEQYCVFILTIPWFSQRLPTVLLPALKHKSIVLQCLRTLLISKEKIFLEMSKLDQSEVAGCCPKEIPAVGWALANIINLATESDNDSADSQQFAQGLNCKLYIHVSITVAENLLACFQAVGQIKKGNHGCQNTIDDSRGTVDPDSCVTEIIGSLKMSYIDLLKPVHLQWHLMTLLTIVNKDDFILEPDNSPDEYLGKLELLDIVYFYSYMLRIFSYLNPTVGSLPILNMLSFTPGFLVTLWGALEDSIFLGKNHTAEDNKPCTSGVPGNQNDSSFQKKQRRTAKDAGNKWVTVLQKITGKSSADVDCMHSFNCSRDSSYEGDSCDSWDVEPVRQGPQGISKDMSCLLHLFCATYSHLLLILDDIEFYEKQVPFKLEQQRKVASVLNTLVYNGFSHSNGMQNVPLMDAAVRCLHLLYERDCRHPFCSPSLWLSPARKNRPPIAAAARAHEVISTNLRLGDVSTIPGMSSVIATIPHVFPFEERVQMFREFIKSDKDSRRMAGEVARPGPGSIEIVVRRGHIVEDGFRQLNSLGSKLKSGIHVSFVSECGLPEAGLDYGGLSKEFLTDISKAAFDPEYGLFSQTSTSEGLLIPNTTARLKENGIQMIEFLGRVVGKALYEGILLDYSFSHAFVQKLLGRYSFLDELSTLDPELYRNLMYLKHYDGDVKDLSLDFTVTEELPGRRVVIELKTGGKDVAVTNENKLQYVHAIADYKLNRQILPLSNAFYRGLVDLISPSWLSLFNASEFNQLLSGGNHDIDVDDLRKNTRYTGGYSEGSRTVKLFWEVMAGFEPKERCLVLKFVTSCSRAPLLGFKHLKPPFTIHKVRSLPHIVAGRFDSLYVTYFWLL
ncbi:E3 ubiquitin-protein ligase UPL7 [Telopea speciosissima]|uniref:E3 ubiquitin-protein ligase UPL7 n=1 Tax=Telopea speciosissima TaxID=54955 RepID=UPI001CC5E881|nr:E3 ubiquitin-protein ligase UPL7 [Telopea speciosissima]